MNRYLLDTHTFLWWLTEDERLSKNALQIIESDVALFLSAASTWEIAIKHAKGRLELPKNLNTYIHGQIQKKNITSLPIQITHTLKTATLPPHHADPFDRILIAQTQLENMILITNDPLIKKYSVKTMW